MQLLTTSSADIIQECRVMFGVTSVSKSIFKCIPARQWTDICNTRCSILSRFSHFHVSHFPPQQHGAAFSCPAISCLAFSASPKSRLHAITYLEDFGSESALHFPHRRIGAQSNHAADDRQRRRLKIWSKHELVQVDFPIRQSAECLVLDHRKVDRISYICTPSIHSAND